MESTSGAPLRNESTKVTYGSAKLTGFLWKDYTCLKPLSLSENSNLTNSTFLAHIQDHDQADWTMDLEKNRLDEARTFMNENKCAHF